MGRYRDLVAAALFAAAALTVFVIEAQIPLPIAIPGIKLGLSNALILMAMRLCGRRWAFLVLLLKTVLGAVFCGTPVSLLYSAAGGLLCYAVTSLLTGVMTDGQIPFLSVAGAVAHNTGQIAVAAAIMGTAGVFSYLPLLTAAAVVTGLFTGSAAAFSVKGLKKSKFFYSDGSKKE